MDDKERVVAMIAIGRHSAAIGGFASTVCCIGIVASGRVVSVVSPCQSVRRAEMSIETAGTDDLQRPGVQRRATEKEGGKEGGRSAISGGRDERMGSSRRGAITRVLLLIEQEILVGRLAFSSRAGGIE